MGRIQGKAGGAKRREKAARLLSKGRLTDALTALGPDGEDDPETMALRGRILLAQGAHLDLLERLDGRPVEDHLAKEVWRPVFCLQAIALTRAGRSAEAAALIDRIGTQSDPYLTMKRGLLEFDLGNPGGGFPWVDPPVGQDPVRASLEWTGAPVEHLVVEHSQGFGDAIQFSRFLPLAQARAGRVTLIGPPFLHDLFAEVFPGLEIRSGLSMGSREMMAARFTTIMRLPGAMGLSEIPPPVSFAGRAVSTAVSGTQGALGLRWSGSRANNIETWRQIDRDRLLEVIPEGWRLVSLQTDGAGTVSRLPGEAPCPPVATLGALRDRLALCERVVTVDTITAHLAGAMGLPVICLVGFAVEWRYPHGDGGTPWYPSMTVLRQNWDRPGDWTPVLDRLKAWLAACGPRFTP